MNTSRTIVVATRNTGKLREFRSLLSPEGWKVFGLTELSITGDPEETGASFAENACLKALFYSRATEFLVLADDSGLEVDSLGGKPGIYSARYAGEDANDEERIQKLLGELDVAGGTRTARFFCALAVTQQGKLVVEAEGECRGTIAFEPRGSHGFGYDPIFFFPELGKTYAELSDGEKNHVSHRANAVRALHAKLGRP